MNRGAGMHYVLGGMFCSLTAEIDQDDRRSNGEDLNCHVNM